jgi:aspartyl-tRNA(Asn)/glutamyl-tRNA(Gln) amidotransferase subunit A
MYLEDIFTVPASLAGLPAVSIPAGEDKDRMPFGVQLIGKKYGEGPLLQAARYVEQIHRRHRKLEKFRL